MANTVWSSTDKSAGITLSGSNLVATATNAFGNGVRSADRQVLGKFYWEITVNTFGVSTDGFGISTPNANLAMNPSTSLPAAAGMCGPVRSGLIYLESVSTGINIGSLATTGTVVCIAVDSTARLVWFRLGAAGNWNNNVANNPVTGVGGISIIDFGNGIPLYPMAWLGTTSDQVTANFGDSAFTGAVPSGFTSGFTAGATIGTNALVTQAAAEQWITTNPPAQVTQVAIEEWASVATVTAPTRPPQFAVSIIT